MNKNLNRALGILVSAVMLLTGCRGVEGNGKNTECQGGSRVNSSERYPGFKLIDNNEIILRNCFPLYYNMLLDCMDRTYKLKNPISVDNWTEANAISPVRDEGISLTHTFSKVSLEDSISVCETSQGDIFTRSGERK